MTALNIHGKESCSLTQRNGIFQRKGFEIWSLLLINILIGLIMPDSLQAQCNPSGNVSRYEIDITPNGPLNIVGQQFCTSQSMGTNCCGNQNSYRCLDIIFNVKNGPMGEMFSDDCSGMANFLTAQGNFDALFFNVGVPDPAGGATNCSAAIQIKNNYTIEVTFTGNNAGQLVLDMRVLDNMGNIVSNQSQVVVPGQSAIFTICKPGFGCVEDEIVFGCCEISSTMVLATNAPSTICTGESTTLKVTGLNGTPPYTATIRETSAVDTSYFDVIINDDMDGNASMDMTTVNVTPLVNTTYKLISIEDATGCAEPGNNQSVSITVLPLPEVDAIMDMTYCDGDMVPSVLFTSNVPGATFSWSRTNENIGLPSTNGTGNVPSFTASNSGNFPITATFSVVATITQNGVSCTGSPKQFTITVNPVPEVNPVQNMTYCSGAVVPAIALSSNVLGATLAWSHTNTAIGLALQNGMGNIPSFTANNTTNSPISSVFSVQATYENNGVMCPGPVIQFTITINPLPRVNPVANQEHCPGIQVPATVFSSNIPGTTFTWTRTVPTPDIGLMPVSGNGNVPSYVSNNPSNNAIVSTFTVTPVFTNNNVSCEGPTLDYTVTILNAPQAMANPGMQTICSGNPITTILLSSNMQGATYSWTRDNVAIVTGIPAAGSGNISGTLVNTTNAPVTVTFTITPTANGCQGNVITATVLVNPTPAAFVVTGGGLVCNTDQVGVPVGLSGSQLNVNYQLLLNGNPAGVPLAGTGGALNFGSPVAPGTYTVVATHAQGACSRTMTGSAIITVFNCSAEIVNACVCLNNGTNLTNSQFGESIKVNAPSNQNWTILSSAGFYSAGSPAPPSAPVSLPNGTPLQNIGGNMFSLDGRHVDAVGYSLSLSNGLGTVFNLSNTCQYPDPVITTDLNGPFCLYSDPVNLAGQPGDANIISQGFTVNGIPATQFDPSQGIGQYIISYTVNGGTPKAFGANDPGCIQTVTQIVNVVATPSNLVCNDLVFVALGDDCIEVINPDMILEGSYLCFDDYIVELDCTPPLGNGPWLPAVVDAYNIGDMCVARVTHLPSGNTCSGMIKVQDNTPPVIICKPITVPCNVPDVSPLFFQNILNIDDAYPSVMDCQGFTLTWTDSEIPQNCASGLTKIINRTWTAKDASGNTATCVQVISFLRPNFQNIDLPPNYDDITLPGFDCLDPYPTPEWIEDQGLQGFPYFMGFPIGCNVNASFTDLVVPVCEGTYTIFRQWTIIDACTGMILNHIQTIRVTDEEGPEFTCPENMVVSVNPFDCCANADLPDIIIRDHCSGIVNLSGFIETFDPFTGDPINTIPIQGTLQNFPGNNLWDSDTLGVFGFTPCLPVGVQKVTYIAQDDCGNTHSCQFDLEVKDLAPPVAACDEFTTVALGSNGMALVNASTFDDGSYDNCCLGNFEVARAEVNDCTDTLFSDTVKFCCSDIGNTVMVTFRVFDCNGNSNDCMVLVEVQDRIKPTCLPPAQANVNCENFDPSLWSYGIPNVSDNCCLDSSQVFMGQFGLTHSVNYALFDTVCNKGTITRTFKTYDCYGNSSQCTQRILVNYKQEYFIKFPNDVVVTVCDGSGTYGEPVFFGEDCELLGVSNQDVVYTVVPDACFKIERNWMIINWCTYNPNLDCIEVPNPNPNAIGNHSSNLPGPVVSACGTLAPWAPTISKITPSDPTATNYCTYYQSDANCYRYKQIIKVVDQQAPTGEYVVPDCDNQAWFTENDHGLWNESYWWDAGIQSNDLCEEPVDLCITATDACSGSNINIEYLLFLDLDGDGTMETVVNSVNTGLAGLGWNKVRYNNLGTPNFSGGTVREFDQRSVDLNQKYGFAIQETVVGNLKTACVRWNTQQQQNNFVTPELPHGTHKIKWFITDGCGNNKEYEYSFTVKDCEAPTVVCLNGLSVNIMPTGMIQLYASDFLQTTVDNCTPEQQLQIGIRKCGQGTGFPLDASGNPLSSVTYDCTELGPQCVELWSIDLAGNADRCDTYVLVQDNLSNCGNSAVQVSGALKTEATDGVEEGVVNVEGTSTFVPNFSIFGLSNATGNYNFNNVPVASTFTIAPEKDDNPLNGVTTYDLVLISKHILGLEPLNSPYKMIAADANKSGSITTFDIVEIRKLILGIYTELPNNTSWRFVDKAFSFPNANNPFQSAFPETKSVADAMSNQIDEDFVGIKVGDVNGSAVANATMQAEERTAATAIFDVSISSPLSDWRGAGGEVKAGEEFNVTFKSAQELKGFQFTATLAGLKALSVVNAENVTENNFNLLPENAMAVSIDGAQEFTVRFRAEQSGKLSEMLGVSGAITRAEAYGDAGRQYVAFRFTSPEGTNLNSQGFELYQNQPNPFVNRTFIGFFLPEAAEATLSVFDETGRLVYHQKGQFAKGENTIALDRALINTTGMLYYKLETATDSATKKMIQGR